MLCRGMCFASKMNSFCVRDAVFGKRYHFKWGLLATYMTTDNQQWELVPIEIGLTVNVFDAKGKTVWIFNAVHEQNGSLKRVEREVVVPTVDNEEFTFNIKCDTYSANCIQRVRYYLQCSLLFARENES